MRDTTIKIKFLFNNGLEKVFDAVSFSRDEIAYHVSTVNQYFYIPLYNILYVTEVDLDLHEEDQIKNTSSEQN